MFTQFFNQEELGALIDRKADLEIVRRLHEQKASVRDMNNLQRALKEVDVKLKHMCVLQSDIAMAIVPSKTAGKFSNQADLNNSLKNREKLLDHAKIICKWIYKKSEPATSKRLDLTLLRPS